MRHHYDVLYYTQCGAYHRPVWKHDQIIMQMYALRERRCVGPESMGEFLYLHNSWVKSRDVLSHFHQVIVHHFLVILKDKRKGLHNGLGGRFHNMHNSKACAIVLNKEKYKK